MEIAQEFQVVPLTTLRESKTNPRRYTNPQAFEDLKQSIRDHGVLVPLLVRSVSGGAFEIVAGGRRYKAAKEAKLKDVPVRVRPLTDTQVLEIQVIENLQREDVHPLDEGTGYRVLIEKAKYDVPALAAKVGKSASYIYQRLKLTDLIDPAKKAFLDGKMTAGHAILIARLQPPDQKQALEETIDDRYGDGIRSVRYLADWIDTNIHLDLHAAPFPKADAMLVKEAGPCTTCPKRTGYSPDLFPDIKKKDTCTDRHCFEKKVDACVAQRKKELATGKGPVIELSGDYHYGRTDKAAKVGPVPHERWEEVKKNSCKSATPGIIVAGRDRGKVVTACANASCTTHHRHSRPYQPSKAEKERQKKEAARTKTEAQVRRHVLDAIVAKVPMRLTGENLRLVARAMFGHLYHEFKKAMCQRRKWEPKKERYGHHDYEVPAMAAIGKMTDAALHRLLFEMALVPHLTVSAYDGGRNGKALVTVARRFRVDMDKVRRGIKATQKAKGKGKPKVQTSAKR